MAKKTNKRQYTTVGQLARIDYLLSDAYEAPKLSVVTGEQKNTKTGKTVQEGTGYYIDLERHRLMSDTTIKYFYEKGSNIIHDKSCSQTEILPDKLCEEDDDSTGSASGKSAEKAEDDQKCFFSAGIPSRILH